MPVSSGLRRLRQRTVNATPSLATQQEKEGGREEGREGGGKKKGRQTDNKNYSILNQNKRFKTHEM